MITTAELHRTAEEEGLRFDQVEKDYVLLWILRGLSLQNLPAKGWVFKGGTCLRHCYYKGYRFSEDIDFSCNPDLGGLQAAQEILDKMASRIQESSGIRIRTKEPRTIPGDFQVEVPLEYSRGSMRTRGLPAVKIHLTFDEPVLTKTVTSVVTPRYSDLGEFTIASYSKAEIVAEKMRALLQQQQKWPRPRDLYDLWFMLCRLKEKLDAEGLVEIFKRKCQVRKIEPDLSGLTSDNLKEWNTDAWENQMKPLMKSVPDFHIRCDLCTPDRLAPEFHGKRILKGEADKSVGPVLLIAARGGVRRKDVSVDRRLPCSRPLFKQTLAEVVISTFREFSKRGSSARNEDEQVLSCLHWL